MGGGDKVYEVKTCEELGRHLVAVRDLTPGEVVISERPVVLGPKATPDPEAVVPCVGCYTPVFTDVGERCASCGWPVCSGHCPGLSDPRHHGLECPILSARPDCVLDNMADYYRHDALLTLRCALLQASDPDRWNSLMEMQSHMESRTPGTEAYDQSNEFIVEYLMNNFIAKLDSNIKSKYLPETSSELLHRICGIIDTNALEIRLSEGIELFALYAETCLVEHSCVPNTKHSFDTDAKDKADLYKINLKIVVPVAKGEHISTMYTHALWGTLARRQHLQDTKCFSCKCVRCSDPTEMGTYVSALKCLGEDDKPCDGIHLPQDPLDDETEWSCSKCSIKVSNSEVSMVLAQMGEEVENVQMMGGSVTMLENLLCRLSTFLHPNHYHLYSVKHSLVQLYGREPGYTTLEFLNKKINMCNDLINVTKTLDPGNARLSLYSGVLYHELHSALVIKSQKAKDDGTPPSVDEMKPLLIEAKQAIENALDALKDDTHESSGKKLFDVIAETKKEFEWLCKEKGVTI